ncbi:SEC-C domain-containing protein [Nocardia sp. 2]|uniref:SEC-C domain-containing protein n=1 Tax=Nocardia acididurans TaxID=2802282 RepID=A0ABS1MHY4_9NOCA|nr:SEC-C domain-containing protein [Nocardia acididurans]MBL1079894.1 SEC-C domain-containing protein [Nocardia acididurans]
MAKDIPDPSRREYERLQRVHAELLAEQSSLRAELADLLADTPSPRELALEYERDAEANPQERAQLLNEAAAHWAMAGDPDRARRLYRASIADGGPVTGDARVWYATFLIEFGAEEEGDQLLNTVFAEGSADPAVYEVVGEQYEERGELDRALQWFDAGLARLRLASGEIRSAPDEYRLAHGRARVRRISGLPEDIDDSWAASAAQESQRTVSGDPTPPQLSIFYFPPTEFDLALTHWPTLRERWPNHDQHRADVADALRIHAATGTPAKIASASVSGLVEYAAAHHADPADSHTRATYAAELLRTGAAITWPPGRNEPCWCGSGSKYKKCCGKPQ